MRKLSEWGLWKKLFPAALMLALVLSLLPQNAVSARAEGASEEIETEDASGLIFKTGGWGMSPRARAYSALPQEKKDALKEAIVETWKNREDMLVLSNPGEYQLTKDDIKTVFAETQNENPEYFYVAGRYGWQTSSNTPYVTGLLFYYEYEEGEIEKFDAKMKEVLALVNDGMSDEEKALTLHDYLAQHVNYAYKEYQNGTLNSVPHVYDAYGALVNEYAVCQGYSEAYSALLKRAGIKAGIAASESMNHAWNLLMIDGNWYHADVTFDDPTWNTEGMARHEFFLLSDTEMQNRKHYGWAASEACTSAKYDSYWWKNVNSRIVVTSGRLYYLQNAASGGFQLVGREKGSGAVSVLYTNSASWKVWNGTGTWVGSYAFLSKEGDYLFFNDTQNLYVMKLSDSAPTNVYSYKGGDGYIYGAMLRADGTARLNISTSPSRANDSYLSVDLSDQIDLSGNKPDEGRPDDNKPDDNKPDDKKPDDNKPDDNKPDDKKPDDKKPDGGKIVEWKTVDGTEYWYEDGVKQGTTGRGKEIYDPVSDAWYWLDSVQGGAKAVSKDVYQESVAGPWGDIDNGDGTRGGKWVRYDAKGHMIKGWCAGKAEAASVIESPDQAGGGDVYYFDPIYGTMAKGYATVGNKEYYFNTVTGILERDLGEVPENGWKAADGKAYWYVEHVRQGYSRTESYRGKEILDPESNAWYWLDNVQNGAKAVSKDVYQTSEAGEWGDRTDETGKKTGKWVRYNADGRMIKGWCAGRDADAVRIDGPEQATGRDVYYFDPVFGTMAKGECEIDGQTFRFDESTGILR